MVCRVLDITHGIVWDKYFYQTSIKVIYGISVSTTPTLLVLKVIYYLQ
jgi:hypothetical protein